MGTATKETAAAPAEDSKELVVPQAGSVALYDASDVGAGFEGVTAADFKPSFLRVLQSNSPQVTDALEGAKPGRIIDSITGELYDNTLFVPAVREHVIVAWKPRNEGGGGGEGFGGVYQLDDPMVVKQLASIPDKFARGDDGKIVLARTPDGEFQLIETVYFHGIQVLEGGGIVPATCPFSSTGLPVAATWFTILGRQVIPEGQNAGKRFPIYAHAFKLGGIKVQKKGNTWFNFTVTWADSTAVRSRLATDSAIFQSAKAVATAFRTGKAKVDYAQGGQSEGTVKDDGAAKGKGDPNIPF